MTRRLTIMFAAASLALLAALAHDVSPASAEGEATWRLEQPLPPPPPPGVPPASFPVPLGEIGDIEFWEPPGEAPRANRGLLITHGNGDAVPPGVWAYDGRGWREIAEVCGATDGRIAWGGPADFWTVSDGRTGQAEINGKQPPLKDDTLCHFSGGSIVASYAHLAFEADSYEAMSGAACLPPQPPATSSTDCWFGGEALPEPQIGSFHLHWNGSTLEEEPYPNQGDPVREMRQIESAVLESVAYSKQNLHNEPKTLERPPLLHLAEAETAMQPLSTEELPLFPPSEETEALEYLRLGSTEGVLWAATGRRPGVEHTKAGEANEAAQVTVLRRLDGVWSQAVGPGGEGRPLPQPLPGLSEGEEAGLLGGPARDAEVRAIAPEPGSEDAWLALGPPLDGGHEATTTAVLLHISAQGEVLGVQTLPSPAERALPSGAAGAVRRLVCPGREDCWMANSNGWLYHLAREGERTLPTEGGFPGFPEGKIIGKGERPPDEGIPQEVRDAPPPDTSGLREEPPAYGATLGEQIATPAIESTVLAPLLSDLHSRLIHKTTLELRFHLAVKARVRLLAKRRKKVVASTPMHTFAAGNRRLLLRLNRREWPTKLSLQTHALAPLPVRSLKEAAGAGPEIGPNGTVTEATDPTFMHMPTFAGLGALP